MHETKVANTKTPGGAKKMGCSRKLPLRKDWEEVKDTLMEEIVHAKFQQNPEIRKVLLGTENKILVEHTRRDRYWGDAGNGSGKNILGQILMKARDALAES